MKLLKIDGRIVTSHTQHIKTLRREKFKLRVIFLEIPFCFHAAESVKVIYKLHG